MAITYLSGGRIQGLLGSVTPAVLATTGWTLFNSDHIITGSDGIRLQSGSDGYSYYDFGASDGINTNDEWVCDFDILRAASNDYYDHPMISLRSVHGVHGNPANNGDCKILLMYWANGNTGNSNGATITNAYHKTSGTVTGVATEVNFCHQTGDTLYYRVYMSKSGDTAGKIRQSAWTSDAYRTAEGSTGRVIDNVSAATMTQNGDWEAADDMRYLIVENSNGNEAWYTLKSFKFWNVASTGVADNMLSHTPTKSLTFNDVAAIPAPDEKATLANAIRVTNTATVAITAETGENEAMHSADGVRRVRQIFSTGHELIGDTITSITMNLKKGGSPTGTATVGIYDSSDDLKADFGSIDSATLTTSFVATTFNYVSGDSSIANGESIQIRFSGGSSGNTVQWQMGTSTLSNTQGGYYDDSWTVRSHSATMSVTHGTASVASVPAGTRFEETDSRKIYRLKASSGSGDVTWDTATNVGMTINGNTVTGTSASNNTWIDRARTVEEFYVGTGLASITFQASQSGYYGDNEQMGFGSGTFYTSGNAATFIEYRMHFPDANPKTIEILENNVSKQISGTWSSVKEYKITIDADGVVRYYLAPTSGAPMELLYTSLIPIAKGTVMYGHAVTGATGDSIVDVRYDFPDSWVERGTA